MATPRPPRARASGGRTLMLLGVLLALAAGTIVVYIVSQSTSSNTQMVTVVVAKQDLPAGTILTVAPTDSTHMSISDAFETKAIPANDVPPNAFQYVSLDDLNVKLNNQVIVSTIYSGDVLRTSDPRLVALGSGAVGSWTNNNPARIKTGDVLTFWSLSSSPGGKPPAVAGDTIDIIVTECNLQGAKTSNGCETQTTLQNVYVYGVAGNTLVLVLSHQDALALKYLKETGNAELVIRKPGDTAPAGTVPVDGSYIVKNFNF